MKPNLFIGSSVESLDLAYAVQEELEHTANATVWNQGVFALSKSGMASLVDAVDESDFGLFILAPDDVGKIRDVEKRIARDNVIFELGLFIGGLGPDRSFIIVPRGIEDLHLPTDLLGITMADFDANREDGNLRAALGPACNRVRKAIQSLGPQDSISEADDESDRSEQLTSDEGDIKALLQSWMGGRSTSDNKRAIRYVQVDSELGIVPGSAERYLPEIARRWNYRVAHQGKETILFEKERVIHSGESSWISARHR